MPGPRFSNVFFLCRFHQAKQIERSTKRTERMSRLKEVAIGQHTEEDVRSAVAKLTEVNGNQSTGVGQRFELKGSSGFLSRGWVEGLRPCRGHRKDGAALA